ncbi:hypothetical protein HHUSO_G29590 [Huso huso]|uniref:Uncharacterized protein n=1 Tax=Huso huso TaxID=61971 RepID=A0ABR0YF46_HUSHU
MAQPGLEPAIATQGAPCNSASPTPLLICSRKRSRGLRLPSASILEIISPVSEPRVACSGTSFTPTTRQINVLKVQTSCVVKKEEGV